MSAAPARERLARALGSKKFIMSMDGSEHARIRAIYGKAMSGKATEGYAPVFVSLARTYLTEWSERGPRDATHHWKRLVYRQLGHALTPLPADEHFHDVVRVFETAVKIGISRVWPEWMGKNPLVHRSKRRLQGLAGRLIEAAQSDAGQATFVHLVLQAAQEGLLDDDDLLVSLLRPYFAGIDTVAATLSSALYALISTEGLVDDLREELDALDDESLSDHRVLRRQPRLRALVHETLRLYSIVILTMRAATRDIEFEGYLIPRGTMMGFCPALPHFMAEFYENPRAFEIGRWLKDDPFQPNTYQPYGVGSHLCLGAGLAEVQLLTTLAVLIEHFDARFAHGHYVLEQKFAPLPAPFRMQVRLSPRARGRGGRAPARRVAAPRDQPAPKAVARSS